MLLKEDATEIPKYFLKMILRKVKRLAQPNERMILPKKATSKDPKFTFQAYPANRPPATPPKKYVTHIHAMAKAQTMVLDIM